MPSDTAPDFFSRQIVSSRRFYLSLSPSPRLPLAVVAGGMEFCTPAYVIERRHFPYCAIELVTAGEGTVQLGSQRHALHAGVLFAYDRSTPHEIRSSADPLQKYFLTFTGQEARHLLNEAGVAPGTCRDAERPNAARVVWDEILQLGARPDQRAREQTALGLRFLLSMLGAGLDVRAAGGQAQATLRRCEAYLQQNFLHLHHVQEVANACHIDLPYLCRLWRRFLGQTPYQYLLHLKMGYAAERLQQGRLVREVADELGLDPYQFSRTFKRVHGFPPVRYSRTPRPLKHPAAGQPGRRRRSTRVAANS